MTNFLLRRFVRGDQFDDPKTRAAVGKLSGLTGIVCNLLLSVGKLTAGALSGSMSITADALNNLSDAASSIVTLWGFKMAEKPADAHHPYGHARSEYLSGLAVAALILFIGFELAKSSISKILKPAPVEYTALTAVILGVSIAVKLWMCLFNRRLGKLIGSSALAATAADSRNDCVATAAVLLAALVEYFTQWRVDGWMGLAVAVFILYSGWNLARETISPLLGEAADPALRQRIVDYIEDCPKVLGYHDLMVHDYGPGQRFASIHVEMDQKEDPLQCHELIDDMERECLESHGIHLVIHYDPVVTNDPRLDRMRQLVLAILHVKDSRLSIHDFRMVPGTGHTNLIFDVALPADLLGQEETIKAALEGALNDLGEGTYYTVITFDPEAFN
ncbi:MAG: cation transporter [Oscillospiraceae bacterium]|nr:cation transporter [Oscillospiraceae bacterium]